MTNAPGFWRTILWMTCRHLWSATSVTEQVLIRQMSACSLFFASRTPILYKVRAKVLVSEKLSLHPNV